MKVYGALDRAQIETVSSLPASAGDKPRGRVVRLSTDGLVYVSDGSSWVALVDPTATQTLTNKTIDSDNNTISNIVNADIKATAAIERTKIADGTADHVVINNGSGTLSSEAALAITRGGTGQTTATAAFDALAPTTTQGDVIYHNGTDNVRLAAGTAGYSLVTNGAGQNPSWQLTGAGYDWTTYTVDYTNLANASTSASFQIETLAANTVIHQVVAKLVTPFTGPGLASYIVKAILFGGEIISSEYDVFNGVASNTNYSTDSLGYVVFGSTIDLFINATSTGANTNAATAGEVTFYILTSRIQ